jgi:hypothetical protein
MNASVGIQQPGDFLPSICVARTACREREPKSTGRSAGPPLGRRAPRRDGVPLDGRVADPFLAQGKLKFGHCTGPFYTSTLL